MNAAVPECVDAGALYFPVHCVQCFAGNNTAHMTAACHRRQRAVQRLQIVGNVGDLFEAFAQRSVAQYAPDAVSAAVVAARGGAPLDDEARAVAAQCAAALLDDMDVVVLLNRGPALMDAVAPPASGAGAAADTVDSPKAPQTGGETTSIKIGGSKVVLSSTSDENDDSDDTSSITVIPANATENPSDRVSVDGGVIMQHAAAASSGTNVSVNTQPQDTTPQPQSQALRTAKKKPLKGRREAPKVDIPDDPGDPRTQSGVKNVVSKMESRDRRGKNAVKVSRKSRGAQNMARRIHLKPLQSV